MFSFKKLSIIAVIFILISGFLSFPVSLTQAVDILAGDLIKATGSNAVYYYATNGGRYCFPNEKAYKTWYSDFSSVKTISNTELAALPLKGNVTYKPGIKMVKIETDPKVYAVDKSGTLRWVSSEAAATALYGSDWNIKVDDISVAFFINYKMGSDVNSISDFDKSVAETGAPSINVDKGLTAAPSEEPSNTLPSAPVINDPGTSVNTGTTFTITWSVSVGATSYNLQRDTNSAFTNPVTIYSATANNTTDTPSPSMPTTYYYRVKANNSAGASSWSNVVSIEITVLGAPNAPTLNDPGTSVNSGTTFNVSWNTVSGTTIYVLERDSNSSFNNPIEIYSGLQASFSQTLSPASDTTYYYRVQARNNVGGSAWSDTVSIQVTTAACLSPDTPTLTDPGSSINVSMPFNVTWSAVTGATSYTLQRDTNSAFNNPTLVYTGGSNNTSENIAAINTYYYRVKATNSCGDSPWSNSVNMIVKAPTYNVPEDYATVQAAVNAAPSGTTINIAAGTYHESVTLKNGVNLKGAGASSTIIDGSGTGQPIYASGVTATVEGLTVQNSNYYGMQLWSSSHVTVTNCIIKNNPQGIGFSGGANTVKNSLIINNTGWGLADGSGNHQIINNTIYGNGTGYYVGNTPYPTLQNNIITNNSIGVDDSGAGVATLKYNNVWNNTTNYKSTTTGANDISVNPKFVNAAGGDFHLQSDSPCIDAGDPTSSYSNEPSPNGSRINMGAYGNTSEAEKKGISYSCAWTWPQKVINADTSAILWTCPGSRPWCNLGYPQCCAEAEHVNCTDMSL